MGTIGSFDALDFRTYGRNERVVCRTVRGLEIGSVICPIESAELNAQTTNDGDLLRRVSPDDQLIVQRIERFRDRAFEACSRLVKQHRLNAILVDVEHLFDGQSLYFYFLGELSAGLQELTDMLSQEYEKKVRFRRFTERLSNGCGPGCGTAASKCSENGCGSCSLKGGGCAQ
jgi:cell fate regulator YaaT (PSP1 superfamily)